MTQVCLPPLEHAVARRFAVPESACDSHAHVFGPFGRYPLAEERSYTPQEFVAADFVRHLDRIGFRRGVVVTGTASGSDNGAVLAALHHHPDRLRGVVVPSGSTSDDELLVWHQAGVRGVRVNLFRHDGHAVYRNGVGLDVLQELAPRLRKLGWHAQIWIHAPDLPALAGRLLALDLPLVIDHMGRMSALRGVDDPGFRHLCRMLAEGSVWTKLSGADRNTVSGAPYDDIAPFVDALVTANPDRIVWGSDWPHVNYFAPADVPDDGILLNAFASWICDESLRSRILVENPARLYDFT